MSQPILGEDDKDRIALVRAHQRIQALEAENRGLRNEIRCLRSSQATTALVRKPKAKR